MSLLVKANQLFREKKYKEAVDIYLNLKELYNFNFLDFNIQLCGQYIEISKNNASHTNITNKVGSAILRVENIDNGFITGWAVDSENLKKQVSLEIFLENKLYSLIETSRLRVDVKSKYGGEGFYGFKGEINLYATFSSSYLKVLPTNCNLEVSSQKHSLKEFQFLLKGKHYKNPNDIAQNLVEKKIYKVSSEKNFKKISVIILNLNGAKVLDDCLKSLNQWHENLEILVVDHASTDNSIEVIEKYQKNIKNNQIKILARDKNYSYSDSNNYGAREATGDILCFMNNDIIVTSNAVNQMVNNLNENFGMIGIKLWDLPRSSDTKKLDFENAKKVNQHIGVHFNCINRTETIEAFELRNSTFIDLDDGVLEVPAVTAAILAIDKKSFLDMGGFSEKYFYGQEDVDLCLKYRKNYDKKIGTLLNHGAFHIRGLTRKELSKGNTTYINNNRKIIQQEFGNSFRKKMRVEKYSNQGLWNHKPISIAMIVSEISFETSKADFFTAKELGDSFEDDNYAVGYFDVNSDYDVNGYDIVIVFIDGFDIRKLKNISPHTQLIAWARNWFDRWCERDWINLYDIIYASSVKAQNYMQTTLKREVKLLRIAAANSCINMKEEDNSYKSDYVFTGSYFNSPREITEMLNPEESQYNFKLFGYNWESHPKFKKYTDGPLSYHEMPKVYKASNLVIDDANIATKKWGALNCRFYDSLATGTLCITNNKIGVKELFEEDILLYGDEIHSKIDNLLGDEKYRTKLVDKYRKIILEEHTYDNRQKTVISDVVLNMKKNTIAIKIAAPEIARASTWGDYYYAKELQKEFELLGYKVRIDCLDQWYGERTLNDDINLVLRGLNDFSCRDDQLNILWVISHPDLINKSELQKYDYTYIASEKFTTNISTAFNLKNISYLPQASAFQANFLEKSILETTPKHEILFIGNSRNEYREVVKWCVEKNLPLAIYGNGWENLVPRKYIKDKFLDNSLIPYFYANAKVVLNDHWKDMRDDGFISNRVYDVLAVNGVLLSDYVVGMENIEYKNLHYYKNKEEFYLLIKKLLIDNQNKLIIEKVNDLSFTKRVSIIDNKIKNLQRN